MKVELCLTKFQYQPAPETQSDICFYKFKIHLWSKFSPLVTIFRLTTIYINFSYGYIVFIVYIILMMIVKQTSRAITFLMLLLMRVHVWNLKLKDRKKSLTLLINYSRYSFFYITLKENMLKIFIVKAQRKILINNLRLEIGLASQQLNIVELQIYLNSIIN